MIELSEEVREARRAGLPLVALESTLLTHGLPRPRNIETARALETAVREAGAVPATVAMLGGRPKVGLTARELEHLTEVAGALKLSTRDLPVAAARGADGGTTVAATMWLAARAGAQVFSTGGIGGVHRGAPRDVSADIAELARTPMIVVCAGPKSVLDVPGTREALESAGVLVAGWRTDEMPAFYSAASRLPVDVRVDSALELAAIWARHRALGAPGAVLLCVPPPAAAAVPADEIETAIGSALHGAAGAGVRGKDLTPYLLAAIARATGGRSLDANVQLLLENARVAAAVAAAVGPEQGV